MKVHATHHEFAGNDKANVWTISEDPEETGWETDSGCDGYGLSREKAEYYAKCINEYPRLLYIIEQAEKALEKSIIQMRNDGEAIAEEMGYKFTDCDVIKEAIEALQVIRGK